MQFSGNIYFKEYRLSFFGIFLAFSYLVKVYKIYMLFIYIYIFMHYILSHAYIISQIVFVSPSLSSDVLYITKHVCV